MPRPSARTLLIAGPVIYLLAEFITAAAWTDPPYSYTYHFISNLGVHGPSTLFGQYMYSPLAWVMNTGFFLFGVITLAGVVALERRRWPVLVPAVLLSAGGILLALFPGSGEAMESGTGNFHLLGALAAFIGGNVLVIVLGRTYPEPGRALSALGVIGLLFMVGYFADVITEANVLIGLVERGIVYPFLAGLIWLGVNVSRRP